MTPRANYSVILPTHERPGMLRRALESVYEQTVLPESVYVVIDEPENSSAYQFLNDYDNLYYKFTGGGYGGARARNVGLDQIGNADFVFFLDDDDEWFPQKIEEQLKRLYRNPNAIGVSCAFLSVDESGSERLVARSECDVNRYLRVINWIGGFSCFGFRINKETRHLRLCPDLPSAQDFEFYIRLGQFGRITVCEKPLMRFHQHSGERITIRAAKTRKATAYRVLEMNGPLYSPQETVFFEGAIRVMNANHEASRVKALTEYVKGLFLIARSSIYTKLGVFIFRRNLKKIVFRIVSSS